MPWELNVWNPNKTALLRTFTHLAPGGLLGGFRWQASRHGDMGNLELSCRNDVQLIPPRAVLALEVDGNPAHYGIAPDVPSLASPDAETLLVLGGREALRTALMDGKVYREVGVFHIVRDVLARLCPAALTYDPLLIGNGSGTDAGPTLDLYYAPTADLVTVLDALAASAAPAWGVDAQGRVFFGRPPAALLSVPYTGQPWRRLQV